MAFVLLTPFVLNQHAGNVRAKMSNESGKIYTYSLCHFESILQYFALFNFTGCIYFINAHGNVLGMWSLSLNGSRQIASCVYCTCLITLSDIVWRHLPSIDQSHGNNVSLFKTEALHVRLETYIGKALTIFLTAAHSAYPSLKKYKMDKTRRILGIW